MIFEGHPHSVTTIQEPLASTSVGILANVYNSKDWNSIAWQEVKHGKVSATLGFCVCLSCSYSKKRTKRTVRLPNSVWDAVSEDRWQVGFLPSERKCHKWKEKACCCGTPESGVPPAVRHYSCNDIGPLTLAYLYRPHTRSSHWLNCHISQQSSWYRRHDGKQSYCTQMHVGGITLSHGRTWEKAQLCVLTLV